MSKRSAFTLPEILIVIAIISVLAAVFLPMLLNPRERAYDAAAISCLKEVSTHQQAHASQSPFDYDPSFNPATIASCTDVSFTANTSVTASTFIYEAKHNNGANTYRVTAGTGVAKAP